MNSHNVRRKRFNTHAEPHGTQAGRGHASELEALIINKLEKAVWKRSQKNVGVSTLSLKIRLIIN